MTWVSRWKLCWAVYLRTRSNRDVVWEALKQLTSQSTKTSRALHLVSRDVNSEEAARDSSSVVSAESSSPACHKTRLVKLGIIIDSSENGPRVAAVKSSK